MTERKGGKDLVKRDVSCLENELGREIKRTKSLTELEEGEVRGEGHQEGERSFSVIIGESRIDEIKAVHLSG